MARSAARMEPQALSDTSVFARLTRRLDPDRRESLRAAWTAFWTSRALVFVVALASALAFDADRTRNARDFDNPALTHPFGDGLDVLLSPLARWDAVWYLGIVRDGYAAGDPSAAFFPLYPLLVWLGSAGGASAGAALLAAYAVSLACLLGALYLLHRLALLEVGPRAARLAVLLCAFFPAAVFLSAPYSESLFLLVSVGSLYAARTGRWAWAGALAAGAAATRSAGLALLVPLVLLWLASARRPRDLAWLALAPLGLAGYVGYLELATGDGLAPFRVQDAWLREFAGPFVGAWDGAGAAWDGLRQLLSGSREPVYFSEAAGDPFAIAERNLVNFGFLVFAAVATWGCFRRLPPAYGAYLVAALALPLSYPVEPLPLMSLPRFVLVLFPIYLWLALRAEERRSGELWLAASAVGLGAFTAQFGAWSQFT